MDIQKKAKDDDFDLSSLREPGAKTPTLKKSDPPLTRRQKNRQGRDPRYVRPTTPGVNPLKTLEEEKD